MPVPDGAPRIPGFTYRGCWRYSLTICTFRRHRAFLACEPVAELLSHILHCAAAEGFSVLAYCFMPDHLHLLVEGRLDESDLPRFVRAFKQRTGHLYARRTGRRLWQVGYFDHVLRTEESTERHALYILGNPVRAGLAGAIGEYPFAGPETLWKDSPRQ